MPSSGSTPSSGARAAPACLAAAALVLQLVTAGGAPAQAAACPDSVATAVSVQGNVQARRAGETAWVRTRLRDTYCTGDMIRVDARSRAAVLLRNGIVLRLDQNTTLTFDAPSTPERSWVRLLLGAVHFVSRVTRSLNVLTPFVNAAVEGTEFWIEVGADQAVVAVIDGRVEASNAAGSVTLTSGQSAIARAGQPPALRPVTVMPPDAVQWALYYPPILDARPTDFPDRPGEAWPALARRSLEAYAAGDLETALGTLAAVPPEVADPRLFTYRAGLLLAVGRADEASADIERALAIDPADGRALALGAVIAVVRNDPPTALRLARRAVDVDRTSAAAALALSYAQQASFDLPAALATAQDAVRAQPGNSLAWARLAELWLASGELDRALEAAGRAVALEPTLPRTQTVLGFAHLSRIDTAKAAEAFLRAIELDPADPLPRLGLGLAKIRTGDLSGGRQELEIALSLDPASALVRSYLGKAYYEEKRDGLAAGQFRLAEELDPRDPTPWLYDAIRKQSVNRPVEALHDLQRAIELNENRAVYRSGLLLDEDLAARGASLARIYDDLGFQQRALLEGWRSLATDPANYSAHRFLSDSYASLPRHEIARVSELLQAQLLQPLNLTPVQPQLALSKSFIVSGAGPADPSLNEFNPLFERNRFSVLASGVAGGNGTLGDEVVVSGLWDRFSFSLGQLHYETDGFRRNADQNQNVYEAFAQVRLSPATSVLADFRSTRFDRGDLTLRFDPDNFAPTQRQKDEIDSFRLGGRHAFSPDSQLVGSFSYQSADFQLTSAPGVEIKRSDDGYTVEGLYLFRSSPFSVAAGAGHFDADRKTRETLPFLARTTDQTIRNTNFYGYSYLTPLSGLTLTVGASTDLFDGVIEREQVNPKLGVAWTPVAPTTVRAAVFRTLKRPLIADQTIEPTQVAGFNQFFDDPEGTDAWRYGVGVDQRLLDGLWAGAEFSWRDLTVPAVEITPAGTTVGRDDWSEQLGRAYVYWTAHPWVALTAEYLYERFKRDAAAANPEGIAAVRTHRVPLGINFFHPSGLIARLRVTWVAQEGDFAAATGTVTPGDDRFWVVDAAVGYRLPRRWGLLTVEAKNLLDERFHYQDTGPANPVFYPERLILVRLTLSY